MTVSSHGLDRRAEKILAVLEDGDPDDLFDPRTTQDLLDVSRGWLDTGRSLGWGPPFLKLSNRLVRYRRGDLIKWLRTRARAFAKRAA